MLIYSIYKIPFSLTFLYIFLIYLQLCFRLEIHQIKYILSDPLLASQIFLPSWEKSRQISSVDKSSPKNQSTGEDYLDRELRNEGTRKHFYPHPLTGKQNPKASLNNDQPNQSSRQPSRRDPETRQKQPMYPLSNHPRVPSPSLYTLDRFPLPLDDRFESRFTAATATRASPSLVFQITKKASKIAFVHRAWVDVTGLQKRGGQKNAGMRFYRLFPALLPKLIRYFRSSSDRKGFVPLSLINLLYPARCVEPIEPWWIDLNNDCHHE